MFQKHLLYLTNTQLTARMWDAGRLPEGVHFQNDADGWEAFSDYILLSKDIPVYFLIDLIEEGFHQDKVPHVFGNLRKSLIKRRLAQLYHDTPYRHARQHGREKTGRKDDIMLFSALTNAPLIKPWVDATQKHHVPVAGVYSVALLSSLLFKKLHLGKEPLLFLTHHSTGLRQNFFHDEYLRFSRLIHLPTENTDEVAKLTFQEITKTKLFLANAHLLKRDEVLKIIVLDNSEMQLSIQMWGAQSESAISHFISPAEAGHALGLKHYVESNYADTLFLSLLATETPPNHYPQEEQNLAYFLWKTRLFLYALSGATMAGCLVWSVANMTDTIEAGNKINQMEELIQKDQVLYQRIVNSMPVTLTNPHDMKSAVALYDLMRKNNSSPNRMLALISRALERIPQIRLNELNWETDDKVGLPATEVAGSVPAPPAADQNNAAIPIPATLIGIPVKPAEVVVLKGEVTPFDKDYRMALESVNQLSAELMRNKHIEVTVVRLPLDIRPSMELDGKTGSNEDAVKANFELRIIWKA